MRSRKPQRPTFQLELLESRTLLAGVDPSAALSATGGYLVDFGSSVSDGTVSIAGGAGVDLTIDLARLPSAIKNLSITGFHNVVLVGTGQFDSLTLGNLEHFWASGVDVQTLSASEVATVSLHGIKLFGMLDGHEMRLEVFDSRSANIYSTLDKLTVASANDVFLISGNPLQEISLDFRTNALPLGPTQKITLPNDSGGETTITPTTNDSGDIQIIHPGEIGPDVVTTFNGSTYTVVVISLSNAQDAQLNKFQDAVKHGDFESARTLFNSYLRSGKTGDTAVLARIPTNTLSEINLAEFGRVARVMERNVSLADSHGGEVLANATDSNPLKLRLFEGQESSGHGASATAMVSEHSDRSVMSSSGTDSIIFVPSSPENSHQGPATVMAPEAPLLDLVRSALSNLTTGLDVQTDTVSAYIIGNLSDQLHPGVRPGLLVDAKPSRIGSDRESSWIQV